MKESNRIELKRELNDSLEKEVVAFLNYREGGHIYIGVDDTTGTVLGVSDSDPVQLKFGDYVFENEWQSFRTKKDRSLEFKSVFRECPPGRRKIAVKVVDIFGNDTMKIIEVSV